MNNGNSGPDPGASLGANLRNCHLEKYLKVKFVRMADCLDMSDRIGEESVIKMPQLLVGRLSRATIFT